jgi:hypothetical protein
VTICTCIHLLCLSVSLSAFRDVPGSGFLLGAWSEIECGRNEGDNFWSYYALYLLLLLTFSLSLIICHIFLKKDYHIFGLLLKKFRM